MNGIRRLANSFFPLGRRDLNALSIIIILLALLSYFNYIESASITGFDDAYMFIRYADNFLSGYGVAWNQDGIQTYGATSILYLFCIAMLRWFFSEIDSASVLIRCLFLFTRRQTAIMKGI